MGEKVVAAAFDLADRQTYRRKLRQCLEALERLLAERRFDRPRNLMGIEIELNLVGADGLPRMMNGAVLERIASRDFQTELGMFNVELNVAPHRLGGHVFSQLAEELRTGIGYAHRKAEELGAGIVMIGILPTLTRQDVDLANISSGDRYLLLNDQILTSRGEDFSWTSTAWSGSAARPPPSHRRRPAPPCNCICRSPRAVSRTCGTLRRPWPPYR